MNEREMTRPRAASQVWRQRSGPRARRIVGPLLMAGTLSVVAPRAWGGPGNIELLAPAPQELRLAEFYFDDATQTLNPPTATADVTKASHLLRLAAAQARLAEA